MRIRAPRARGHAPPRRRSPPASGWFAFAVGVGVVLAGIAQAEEGGERSAEANADAAAPDQRPVAIAADAAPQAAPAGSPPTRWAPSKGNQCHRSKGRRSCEGPRKVPVATGEALERAKQLGLSTPHALLVLQRQVPPEPWVAAAGTVDADAEPLLWPVDGGRYLRGYGLVRRLRRRGQRRGAGAKRLHGGVDIGAAQGTVIRAARGGLVAYSDNGVHGYGNLIMVVHADATVAWYAHCRAAYVAAGELVTRGQAIGEVGQTGLARGPHLHFELRRGGHPFDPLTLLERPTVGRSTPEPSADQPDRQERQTTPGR
jgi:murein DD-endopeptidase MepM/ murein hydrolase activator NlpD